MKDKTYHIKHDFGGTTISYPDGGFPINLNINMTFRTFTYLLSLIFATGFIVINVIEVVINVIKMVSETTGG